MGEADEGSLLIPKNVPRPSRPGLTLIETLAAAALLAFVAVALSPFVRTHPPAAHADTLSDLAHAADALLAAHADSISARLAAEPNLTLESPGGGAPISVSGRPAGPHADWFLFERSGALVLRWRPSSLLALPLRDPSSSGRGRP